GLSGFCSVPDHRSTGRSPHPHHCGTFKTLPRDEVLTHGLWLLDRDEHLDPWLLFPCILFWNLYPQQPWGDDDNGNWDLGFPICISQNTGAKLSQIFLFATSLNCHSSYMDNRQTKWGPLWQT
ncbi:hypothetical protein PIB30_097667, partial [Stylosanthes scabra]|nr:hypothetical protein [Stylosanthes scabra]